ncbi:class I SAM-dependent methyltransferase [Streptomyces boninensis]|uniref:class I SAM-dependent methyltransferase n=1 Tax=Streptomyces boninensis TaxID=2039455 RepID=UPI003B220E67
MEATNLFYRNPALYDAVQADTGSAAACQALIERHHPDATTLVDFGCGTARDIEALAKRYDTTGVDLQPQMVEYAHRVRPGLDIREGDMRTVRLGERMDAITCLGNSLAYVHDNDDISRVFETFASHANTGAVLVLCSPVWPITQTVTSQSTVRTADGPAQVTIRHEWDLRTQINTMHRDWTLPSGERAHDTIRRRVLFPRELEHYVTTAGFQLLDMADDPGRELAGPVAYTVAKHTR